MCVWIDLIRQSQTAFYIYLSTVTIIIIKYKYKYTNFKYICLCSVYPHTYASINNVGGYVCMNIYLAQHVVILLLI